MVTLTEVPDEHFEGRIIEEDDGDFTDTDSEISNESNFDASSETVWDRIFALRMIIPASTRYWAALRARTAWNVGRTVFVYGGKFVWMASATAMLFGVPYGLCYLEEQQLRALEQEQMQKAAGDELLTGGGGMETSTADQLAAALNGQSGKVEARPAL